MKSKHPSKSTPAWLLALIALTPIIALAETPFPDLHIGNSTGVGAGNGTIVAEGKLDTSPLLDAYAKTAGDRMLWYPRKAAFRVGSGIASHWNDANFGYQSTAMGCYNMAFGSCSTAIGGLNTASGEFSTAMGDSNTASGEFSTAMGESNMASGNYSTAIGGFNTASGECSTAMGDSNTASGEFSTGMGRNNSANAYSSTVMGENNMADSLNSTVIGRGNIGGGDPVNWNTSDPLFEIGNGTLDSWPYEWYDDIGNGNPSDFIWGQVYHPGIRSNAVTVYKNGDMDVQGVITCAPGGDIPMFSGN